MDFLFSIYFNKLNLKNNFSTDSTHNTFQTKNFAKPYIWDRFFFLFEGRQQNQIDSRKHLNDTELPYKYVWRKKLQKKNSSSCTKAKYHYLIDWCILILLLGRRQPESCVVTINAMIITFLRLHTYTFK